MGENIRASIVQNRSQRKNNNIPFVKKLKLTRQARLKKALDKRKIHKAVMRESQAAYSDTSGIDTQTEPLSAPQPALTGAERGANPSNRFSR